MDFSTKAKEAISIVVAEEMSRLIEVEEIRDLEGLENGLREMLKEVGGQSYGKVLEREDDKLGRRVRCECVAQARRISKREGQVLRVFGWVRYRRSYYGCTRCGQKVNPLDQDWDLHPGEVSVVMGKLLAIAGVDIAFEKARRKIKEFLLVEVSDNTIRKQTQRRGHKQARLEGQWIAESEDEAWLQERERTVGEAPDRLYGSIDGAQVPIGEEWRELKSLSWYRVAEVYGQEQHQAQEISYHGEIAPAQEFGRLLWATGVRRRAGTDFRL